MKKTKRILALIGVVLLVLLYLSTLFFALSGNENAMDYFKVSVYATIIVPVLIWAYTFIYKLMNGEDKNDNLSDDEEKE